MADRYELASAIFGTKRAETDASSLSSAIITGTAVEDSEEGVVKIVPDGNVIAPDGEDNTIILPTSPNVKEGDNVIIISTGGTATTPIVTGASGSGDRIVSELNTLLTDVEGIETLIRETTDGVLVAKVGQTVGALVNADGSFDVVEITGWNDGVPTVGDAISSFGENNAYIGAFQLPESGYPTVNGSFKILPLLSSTGSIYFAPLKIETEVNSGDLSFSNTKVTTQGETSVNHARGSITWGWEGSMSLPADYPWVVVSPTNSNSMLVESKLFIGSYSPGGVQSSIELNPNGNLNASGDITANSFTGSVDWSNIVNAPDFGGGAFYGTCDTSAGTQEKAVTCAEFASADLSAGTVINVKFTNAQTYNGAPTLNVNSTGAVAIKRNGTTNAARYEWLAGEVVSFVYDGESWLMENGGMATTTYYGYTKLSSSTSSTSASVAATPAAVKIAYDLANGKQDPMDAATNADVLAIFA